MKRSHSSHPSADTAFRRLVWHNIAVQAALPLAVAFTPVMAGAGEQHFLQQPGDDDTSASAPEGDEQAQKVAGYASQAGSFLAGSAKSDAAASMARGMVTGEAGGALQQWLSHFGTARVQLDADKNFSLKNSQFDLLMPLYDRGDNLAFTQGSLHRTDSRTQANLGAGWRHFTPYIHAGREPVRGLRPVPEPCAHGVRGGVLA
ncbi:intimin-like protein [Citrobacter koseri]|nr:intimin-like protein [Citrobacter koseri]STT23460.1 invasin [Citrobacter koseri]